ADLVQDAKGIRDIFDLIKDDIPDDLSKALVPVARIEFLQSEFIEAKTKLTTREAQVVLSNKEQQCISDMVSMKDEIDQLNNNSTVLISDLSSLEFERDQLTERLQVIN
ncbi:hypothetical protein, partial [Aeromonas jandaei]|uniref:hypothetical protein n=1 Tax=Aeromonas jandaei TaxID=650 RepID=UPI0018DE4FB8